MKYYLHLQELVYKETTVAVYVPNGKQVQELYLQQKKEDEQTIFPYWSKIWAAAYAMSEFLIDHLNLISNKNVVELAAGLALPSLVAAKYATSVYVSDQAADAMEIVQHSAKHNGFVNITTKVLDWKQLQSSFAADIVLMSDINYEPSNFEALYYIISNLLQKDITIILSTPQRLMAKTFIEKLLPFATMQENKSVIEDDTETEVSIFVLKAN